MNTMSDYKTKRTFRTSVKDHVLRIAQLDKDTGYIVQEPGNLNDANALVQAVRTELSRIRRKAIEAKRRPKRFRLLACNISTFKTDETDLIESGLRIGTEMFNIEFRKNKPMTASEQEELDIISEDED